MQQLLDCLVNQGVKVTPDGLIDLPDAVKRVRIDIGLSGNAPQTKHWLEDDPCCFVLGFEPSPVNITMLRHGSSPWPIKLNPDLIGKRVAIMPYAVGCTELGKFRRFYCTSGDSGTSSLLEPKSFSVEEIIDVPVITLKSILTLIPPQRFPVIDYVKSDCQGADFEVLRSAGELATRIALYTLEVDSEQYIGTTNNLDNIVEYFKTMRFKKLNWFNRIYFGLGSVAETDDPTFINVKCINYLRNSRVRYYQRG